MIRFIYGIAGSGKSTYIASKIMNDLQSGENALLIVPEQQMVETEQRFAEINESSDIPVIGLEILNFTRLANRVFRRFGGLSYNYIGNGARQIIMWRVLFTLSPVLAEYRNISLTDKNILRLMQDTISEFIRYNITPVMLENAVEQLDNEKTSVCLKNKLKDLSLIYTLYQKSLRDEYDNPEDDLTRLAKTLEKNNFFNGYNVYIDSFDGFTPQQISIIEHILRQADNITVSFAMLPDSGLIMLDGIKNTEKTLKSIIKNQNKIITDIVELKSGIRFKSPELKYLEKYLWDFGQAESVYNEKTRHIKLIECSDVFCEAEATAKDILRRVRQGGRFLDNIIIMRDPISYVGIIDVVFEKYDIPYFMSIRTDLKMKPSVKLLLSALTVISGNWRCNDVISYIKTGYSGITVDECDLLESYVSTWEINGYRWTNDMAWNMNPDGYTDILSEYGKSVLISVNQIREKLTAPLVALSDSFSEECTVKSASEAVYRFLCDLNIREKLEALGEDEPKQVWNIIISSLDQLVKVAPDAVINAEQYMRLISIIFDDVDIGRIPTSMDEVIIGGAMSFRAGRAKNIYILGVNENIFPQIIKDEGIFNDIERITLETLGIILSPRSDRRASDELLYFYKTVTSVEENVTVLYSTTDLAGHALQPSPACTRMRMLFSDLTIVRYSESDPLDLIEGYEASFEYAAMYNSEPVGESLKSIYLKDEAYKTKVNALEQPFIQPLNTILSQTASELFGGDLILTQTRLESYVLCAFSYYCKYVLRLTEKKRAEIKSVDIGNFIHRILEIFLVSVKTENGIRTDLTDDEIENLVDKIINDYLNSIIYNAEDRTNRIIQLFRRLKRTTMLLIRNLLDEFEQSNFIPTFFELPIKFGDSEASDPLKIPLPDNTNAYIFGKVDRVDTYKKGNDVYIRVVDYKTGIKDFSLTDIQLGLNLQMLLYLFSLWQYPSESFKMKAGCEKEGRLLPAGVLYFTAKAPDFSLDKTENEQTVIDKANYMLTRKGLLLNDKEILTAMEKNLNGRFIPVKLTTSGEFTAISPVKTLSEFGILMRDISDTVSKFSILLKSGKADAIPLKAGKHNACEYCAMKPVCRTGNFG